jgi:hypothetical protein
VAGFRPGTQKEVPPKARWGEAAAIVEMPNEIAISTHRPEEKCRDMGSLCHVTASTAVAPPIEVYSSMTRLLTYIKLPSTNPN